MRIILTILIFLPTLSSLAQNWQMFPPGEQRYYINPIQDSVNIQGIDFKEYSIANKVTNIELGVFARYDTIRHGQFQGFMMQITSANSNYGNSIVDSDTLTKVAFNTSYDSRINADTMIFRKRPKVSERWLVLENDKVIINATVTSILSAPHGDGDSIMNIVLSSMHKLTSTDENKFQLQVSKHRGILKAPVFYDILAFPEQWHMIPRFVEWKPYKEQSKTDYFRQRVGTETHFYEYRIGGNRVVKRRVIGYEGDTVIYRETTEGETYREIPNPNTPFVKRIERIPYRYQNQIVKEPIERGEYIFNPIPNKIRDDEHYSERGYEPLPTYQEICDRLVRKIRGENYLEYSWHRSLDGDTILYKVHEGTWDSTVHMQGVGLFNEHKIYPGKQTHREQFVTKFFDVPNSCTWAENAWRLTNVEEVFKETRIYPNPVSDVLYVDADEHIVRIALYNLLGAEISSSANTDKLDVSHLPNGVYLVRVQTASNQYAQKVVINHH